MPRLLPALLMITALTLVTTSCSTLSKPDVSTSAETDPNLNSTLWVQSSAEYRAVALQTYQLAAFQLSAQLQALTTQAAEKPLAVVFDLDETVINNSRYQAQLIRQGETYTPESWDEWVSRSEAAAIPGAVEFIHSLQRLNVTPVFITNRACSLRDDQNPCPQKSDTAENLKKIGIVDFDDSQLMLKNEQPEWTSEKQSRRDKVAEGYDILMLFGDDLGDFLPDVKKNITPEERAEITAANRDEWGVSWFMLPNPMYGSWQSVLTGPDSSHLLGY